MAFTPRLNSYGIYGDSKWYSAQNPYFPYFQMPNCTAYAYGRFWELTGQRPVGLCGGGTGNGGEWFTMTSAYTKSNTPVVGSIICWNDPNGNNAGHVAVVEAVDTINNTITVSQSGWVPDTWSNGKPGLTQLTGVTCNRQNGQILPAVTSDTTKVSTYFWIETLTLASGYRKSWHMERNYVCQGFIHPDNTGGYVPPTNWIYDINNTQFNALTQAEMENNATLAWIRLAAKGWCLESVAAMLGNAQYESGLNPGQVEVGWPMPTTIYGTTAGVGLIGFTAYLRDTDPGRWPNPALWYADYLGTDWYDGDMQIDLIDKANDPVVKYLGTTSVLWIWGRPDSSYDTYEEFRVNANHRTVEDLASEYLYCMEKPGRPWESEAQRRQNAINWYNYLLNVDPGAGGGSIYPATQIKKMPIWAMIRYH